MTLFFFPLFFFLTRYQPSYLVHLHTQQPIPKTYTPVETVPSTSLPKSTCLVSACIGLGRRWAALVV